MARNVYGAKQAFKTASTTISVSASKTITKGNKRSDNISRKQSTIYIKVDGTLHFTE